jgi:hypothetical protein
MSAFTPGPWSVGPRREIFGQAFDDSAKWICDKVRGGSPSTADANARLIAAAPDLLDALKAVVAMYGPSADYSHEARATWEQAERALTKAESGEP